VTNEIVKNLKLFTAKKHFLYVKYNTLKVKFLKIGNNRVILLSQA